MCKYISLIVLLIVCSCSLSWGLIEENVVIAGNRAGGLTSAATDYYRLVVKYVSAKEFVSFSPEQKQEIRERFNALAVAVQESYTLLQNAHSSTVPIGE